VDFYRGLESGSCAVTRLVLLSTDGEGRQEEAAAKVTTWDGYSSTQVEVHWCPIPIPPAIQGPGCHSMTQKGRVGPREKKAFYNTLKD
jgi:hypothetical protein